MKKIGIITHYYKSTNYGGVLQAYALCRFLQSYKLNVEQIQYDKTNSATNYSKIRMFWHQVKNLSQRLLHWHAYKQIDYRKDSFRYFREECIPHSEKVYDCFSSKELSDKYDVYITGSDQVWHPQAVCDAYLLKLQKEGLKKISYAASVAKNELTQGEQDRYKEAFRDFHAISVREKAAVNMIQELSTVPVKWVVDPVFLLSAEKWKEIIPTYVLPPKYIFCYFLGNSKKAREVVTNFARQKNLKIITIPYLENQYRSCDCGFGECLPYLSPPEVLRAIANAEYIFTDSFHIMAFSLIFHKEFFVFERKSVSTMNSRILSLTELFDVQSHFWENEQELSFDLLKKVMPIDYSKSFDKFEALKKESIAFIEKNIVQDET